MPAPSRLCASAAATIAVSVVTLTLFFGEAAAQDAAKPAAAPPATAAPATSDAAPAAKEPALPEVKVIQDQQAPKAIEEAAPKIKPKPKSVAEPVEPDPPAPAKPKKKIAKAAKPKAAPAASKPVAPKPTPVSAPATEVPAQAEPTAASDAATAEALNAPNAAVAAGAKLDIKNTTGSALKLTPRETPATVNIVGEREVQERGAQTLIDVLRTVPGVMVGNNPGEPGALSVRGVHKAVGYSVDGSRAPDPVFVSRDFDAFSIERVEFLKGPASVVHGTSGLAGAVNIVTKQATTDRTFVEGVASFGSFDTSRLGAGFNVAISPAAAFRSTFVHSQSTGFVDDTDWEKISWTNNLLLKPSDGLTVRISADYNKDDFGTAYWGAPLIPAGLARDPTNAVSATTDLVLDRSLRHTNYNYEDGKMDAESVWLRGTGEYKLNPYWTLKNETNYYTADRTWADAEFFNYSAGFIQQSANLITHDHEFWSNRTTFSFDGQVAGMRNRIAAGGEYMQTSFASTRHFGNPRNVAVFDPIRGFFPVDNAANFDSGRTFHTTDARIKAAFFENAINLTPDWLVAGGIRHEAIEFDRQIRNDNTGLITTNYQRDLSSTTWRIGSTYEVFRDTAVFAQYAESVIPVSALLTASFANGSFDLATGRSVEAGFRNTAFAGNVVTTASIYQIEEDNILTRDPANPTVTIQGGSLRSRGIELETAIAVTDNWNVTFAGTLIDSEFTKLTERAGGVAVDRSGNRPFNVSPYLWTVGTSYRLTELPLTIGGTVRGVGPFYTNNANTIRANGHTLLDAWVAFDVGKGTLRVTGRNLTDEVYAEWADYNPAAVYLGMPRSFDVSYTVKW